jgi:hypothetical protein
MNIGVRLRIHLTRQIRGLIIPSSSDITNKSHRRTTLTAQSIKPYHLTRRWISSATSTNHRLSSSRIRISTHMMNHRCTAVITRTIMIMTMSTAMHTAILTIIERASVLASHQRHCSPCAPPLRTPLFVHGSHRIQIRIRTPSRRVALLRAGVIVDVHVWKN